MSLQSFLKTEEGGEEVKVTGCVKNPTCHVHRNGGGPGVKKSPQSLEVRKNEEAIISYNLERMQPCQYLDFRLRKLC